ncbi:uncharacterized protein LOC133173936 [Saccostrea echinata]|uniref:uncharacterized protein LOC133173936 n=1 Tax=Saccostrea echinata TaxID=191078 RepID=UPI002A81E36D|nr:uncharacterized protein LOC133173936 [Saccostrea echinata]
MAEYDSVEVRFGSPQVCVTICKKHSEIQSFFCNDCDEFICTDCAKTDHRSHDWNTVRKASTKRKSRLSGICLEIRDEELPNIAKQIEKIDSMVKQNLADRDGEISKLEAHSRDIVSEFTKCVEESKKVLESGVEKKNKILLEIKSKLKEKETELRDRVDELEGSHSLSDYNLLNVNYRLNKVSSIVKDDKIEDQRYSLHFKNGAISRESLKSLLGEVKDYDDFSLTKIASFKHEKGDIIALEVDNYENAVLVASDQTYFDKVTKKGKLRSRNEIGCDINDIAVFPNGDILFSDSGNGAVIRLTNNKLTTIVETSPLTPEGLSLTTDGDFLVTMADPCGDTCSKDCKGLVKLYSLDGHGKKVYEYQEDGGKLFTLPFRIAENINTDICVLDNLDDEHGVLKVISRTGSFRFIYNGKQGHLFFPVDIVCDNLCNLIVMDAKNYTIHLLDSGGDFIKYLRTDQEDKKASLSLGLCGDILWTGGHSGHLNVYRYTNKF